MILDGGVASLMFEERRGGGVKGVLKLDKKNNIWRNRNGVQTLSILPGYAIDFRTWFAEKKLSSRLI